MTIKLSKLKLDKKTTISWMERIYEKLIKVILISITKSNFE